MLRLRKIYLIAECIVDLNREIPVMERAETMRKFTGLNSRFLHIMK